MNPEEFHKYYPRLLGWIDTTLSMSALPPKADICSAHCIAKLELPSSMSALGQKQTFAVHQSMSALPPRADIRRRSALYAGRQHLRLKIGFDGAQSGIQRRFMAEQSIKLARQLLANAEEGLPIGWTQKQLGRQRIYQSSLLVENLEPRIRQLPGDSVMVSPADDRLESRSRHHMNRPLMPCPSRGKYRENVTVNRADMLRRKISDDMLRTNLGIVAQMLRNERLACRIEDLDRPLCVARAFELFFSR